MNNLQRIINIFDEDVLNKKLIEIQKNEFNNTPEYTATEAKKFMEDWIQSLKDYGRSTIDTSHKFYLDVEKAQAFYDEYKDFSLASSFQEFVPPFDNCLFTFEKPLHIKFYDINKKDYIPFPLIAISFYKALPPVPDPDMYFTFEKHVKRWTYGLFFDVEKMEGDFPDMVDNIFSLWGEFDFFSGTTAKAGKSMLLHLKHGCRNSRLCGISETGHTKWEMPKDKIYVCQEVLARDSFVETLVRLVNKIHEVQVEIKHKEKPRFTYSADKYSIDKILPSMPFGWPHTKGNLPKDNYVQHLDGKRYKYDKDEIDIGSGVKHRYRYDVRRHMRVVGGKITWINYHQRGSGRYIPKIYSNHKTWLINYFWYQAEKLTKYRIIEVLIVKTVYFLRKFGRKK